MPNIYSSIIAQFKIFILSLKITVSLSWRTFIGLLLLCLLLAGFILNSSINPETLKMGNGYASLGLLQIILTPVIMVISYFAIISMRNTRPYKLFTLYQKISRKDIVKYIILSQFIKILLTFFISLFYEGSGSLLATTKEVTLHQNAAITTRSQVSIPFLELLSIYFITGTLLNCYIHQKILARRQFPVQPAQASSTPHYPTPESEKNSYKPVVSISDSPRSLNFFETTMITLRMVFRLHLYFFLYMFAVFGSLMLLEAVCYDLPSRHGILFYIMKNTTCGFTVIFSIFIISYFNAVFDSVIKSTHPGFAFTPHISLSMKIKYTLLFWAIILLVTGGLYLIGYLACEPLKQQIYNTVSDPQTGAYKATVATSFPLLFLIWIIYNKIIFNKGLLGIYFPAYKKLKLPTEHREEATSASLE